MKIYTALLGLGVIANFAIVFTVLMAVGQLSLLINFLILIFFAFRFTQELQKERTKDTTKE